MARRKRKMEEERGENRGKKRRTPLLVVLGEKRLNQQRKLKAGTQKGRRKLL